MSTTPRQPPRSRKNAESADRPLTLALEAHLESPRRTAANGLVLPAPTVVQALIANLGLLRIMFHEAGQRDFSPPSSLIAKEIFDTFKVVAPEDQRIVWSLLRASQPSCEHDVVDFRLFSRALRKQHEAFVEQAQRTVMTFKAHGGRNKSADVVTNAYAAAAQLQHELPTPSQPPLAKPSERRSSTSGNAGVVAVPPARVATELSGASHDHKTISLTELLTVIHKIPAPTALAPAPPPAQTARRVRNPASLEDKPRVPAPPARVSAPGSAVTATFDPFAARLAFAAATTQPLSGRPNSASTRAVEVNPATSARVDITKLAAAMQTRTFPTREDRTAHSSAGAKSAFAWNAVEQELTAAAALQAASRSGSGAATATRPATTSARATRSTTLQHGKAQQFIAMDEQRRQPFHLQGYAAVPRPQLTSTPCERTADAKA